MLTTLVSFVVVNWGEVEATELCVESIRTQHGDAQLEIIIVDNESTPASRARLKAIPQTLLVAHEENRGFTGGMNAGFAIATGDFVAAINNDLVLAPEWLARGLAEFDSPNVGIVGGLQYLWDGENPVGDRSNAFYTLMFVDQTSGYSFHSRTAAPTQDVVTLDGSNLLIARSALDLLKGFDDDFFAYYEEVDLCARALALGYRLRYCAEMEVWHRRNLSSDRIPYRRTFLAERNHLTFVAMHFPTNSWRRTVRRLAAQYLLFGLLGREAGPRARKSVPRLDPIRRRAHIASGLWGLGHRSYLARKRQQLETSGQRSDAYVDQLAPR